MGLFVVNLVEKEMASSHCSSTKTERKIIEKNRRNQMKTLYSKLNSLLPNQSSKEALSLPCQIDEAINYIKNLQTKLEKIKEKKENLTGRKRLYSTCSNNETMAESSKSPKIDIREMGSALEVTLISGTDNHEFVFYEIVRMIHEEGAEVVNASFSIVGDSTFHVIHAEIKESASGFGTARMSERLKKFVTGSSNEVELQPEPWDFEFCPETWPVLNNHAI